MDIRNIHINPEDLKVDPTQYLHKMYELGSTQLEGYKSIEKLPDYPLDINTAKSQVILKDFINRVVEELTEGYESTSEATELMESIGWNISLIKDYKALLNSLQNANEEQADAIGFYITLLLYSNILPEDIFSYVSLHLEKDITTLDEIMSYGVKILYEICPDKVNLTAYGLFDASLAEHFGVNYQNVLSYTPGFNSLSPLKHEAEAFLLWNITYQINIARNLLKNRPWKQTQVMTKELEYQEAVVKSFIMYLGFLAIYGLTSSSLFELFYRKQQLNLWRQQTGY